MKNDLSNLLFFLSKPIYSRFEVSIMLVLIFFVMIIYSNTMDFALGGVHYLSSDYLLKKLYLNWLYLLSLMCIISYAKILKYEELDLINFTLNKINNNLDKISVGEFNG